MRAVELASETDFEGWRGAARDLRLARVAPEDVRWSVARQDLFAAPEGSPPSPSSRPAPGPRVLLTVPAAFPGLAADVLCHRSPERFDILYRLLWRLQEDARLLHMRTDADVTAALDMAKAVSRASHKMKAFVRFRRVADLAPETYVAWFEPPHRVLERTASFFVNRFVNLRFSILTPDLCCHWDGDSVRFAPGANRGDAPAEDDLESYWLTYYANIFNPARLKVAAMQSEMPKRYWRNLPEAQLIPSLIEGAHARTVTMIDSDPTETARRLPASPKGPTASGATGLAMPNEEAAPGGLDEVAAGLQGCRRCGLWRDATQGVPGEGPADAALMLVGEQPGDSEDLAGRPFVGPAGQMLERALAEAGIARSDLYVTNAVKHFKHEARGKRRLHKTPVAGEITACRWWLDNERRLVRPKVIVAMGGTAALAVFGRVMPILKSRGQAFALDDGAQAMITVHPSYLLRLPDEAAKREAYGAFVRDLEAARELMAAA